MRYPEFVFIFKSYEHNYNWGFAPNPTKGLCPLESFLFFEIFLPKNCNKEIFISNFSVEKFVKKQKGF